MPTKSRTAPRSTAAAPTFKIADAEMPKSTRGRTAEPIPAELLAAVKDSYKGMGKAVTLTKSGKVNKQGDDTTLVSFRSLLRRAAEQNGHGISIATGHETATTVQVLFKAKDKNRRKSESNGATADE